jgi:hypothetical protein
MPNMPDLPVAEAAIIQQTNAFRAGNKLPATTPETALTKAARDYARFLAQSTLFTHEADGRRPIDRVKAAGYKPCTSAENLAMLAHSRGFETAQLATMMVEGWKASPGHRKNMMLPFVTETGVAIAKVTGSEKYIGVQLFGRPDSLVYHFTIDNQSGRAVSYSLGSQALKIEPRMLVKHGGCEPGQLAFETKPGSPITNAVTAKFQARDGQTYRLSMAKNGDIVVEVKPQ